MFFTNSLLYDFIAAVSTLLTITIVYCKWTYASWRQKGFEGPMPSIPFGNAGPFLLRRAHFGEIWRDIYFYAKDRRLRYSIGFFCVRPSIVPVDLELIKSVLRTDFIHFSSHGSFANEEADPLSANLFNSEGHKWKSMRIKVTPTFTSGKMKMMFQTVVDCAERLKDILDEYCRKNEEIELKEYLARYTTDVIGSCAFGLDCDSMKNPNSEFRKYGLQAVNINFKQTLKHIAQSVLPHSLLHFIKFRPIDPQVARFFTGIVKETVDYRERNNIRRNDLLDLLIQIKNKESTGDGDSGGEDNKTMTMNEITAQSFVLFLAGFETSATTLQGAAYELATNPDIQDRVREEIVHVLEKHGNVLSYEAMAEMEYLHRTICETLRKYPVFPTIIRKCSKEYTIPGTDKLIKEGTSVMVPVLGVHYDPEYYPNPEIFDPDRFTEENKAKRPVFAWLGFGEGPRMCLGMRFGLMETKVGLITLLRNFKVSLHKKTNTPLVFSKHGFLMSFEGEVLFDLQKV